MAGFARLKESYDFVILGGGHAGLQAGLKAALLGYTAAIIDRGIKFSRSFYAPKMDNIPGFPEGVSGHVLLDRQVESLRSVGEAVGLFTPARAVAAAKTDSGFSVEFDWLARRHTARGKVLVLALGVVDRIPEVGGRIDTIFPWANQAIVEFCILCDGHTLPGKTVAVLGSDAFAARTALDLLHFRPKTVEMLLHGQSLLVDSPPEERAALNEALSGAKISTVAPVITGFDG
ncbi:MAG TPA: FAD-dependent oxidoreductase, partial [Thermoplasmata archaeon]|nr:FAD-dependent oxidoreductase [Thermoplasmata archaeon]